MPQNNRPQSHNKKVSSGSGNTHRRGDGLGTGPVGSGRGSSGRKGPSRAALGGGLSLPVIIIIVLYMLFGGGGGGGTGTPSVPQQPSSGQSSGQSSGGSVTYQDLFPSSAASSQTSSGSSYSNAATTYSQTDTAVAEGSRAKRTKILGGGKDTVTMMVYMCGTDLESRSGMATSDLQEMVNADIADNVNIIVYTGGCRQWRVSDISNTKNQIYQVVKGGLRRLVDNDGSKVMTDPATLSSFIKWTAGKFPAMS